MTHHLTTLPNGVRVVTVPLHDTQAVTVLVMVKVGSRYESARVSGASHFIEHLMFKGTTRRPTSLDISKELDGIGASYNAFTAKDYTGYYVKAHADHTELAVDMLGDIVQHARFDQAEIDRERGVIIEEIKMYAENPVMGIDDECELALFGAGHPLGRNITGPASTIARITRADLITYRDAYYRNRAMWVIVAGRMKPSTMPLVRKHFGGIHRRGTGKPFPTFRPHPTPAVRLIVKDLQQAQLALGFRSLPYNHPDMGALSVLSVILGGNMSSRLFIEVREKRGLAYSIGAGAHPYEDTGVFAVQAGLEVKRVPEALRVIMKELRQTTTSAVSAEELHRAKEYIRGRTVLAYEDGENLAGWYGRQALFGKRTEAPAAHVARIMKVTAEDVRRVAASLFRPGAGRLALIAPKMPTAPLAAILRGRSA